MILKDFYYTRHALCIVPCTGSVSLDEFICALIRGNVNIECLVQLCVSASKYKLFTKQQTRLLCSAISTERVFTSGIPHTQNGLSLRFRTCVLIPSSVCILYFLSPSYTQDGFSPLYSASQLGYDGIVEQLILAGAIVDLQVKVGIATTLNDRSPSASHVPSACWYLAGWVWNCI